MQSGDKFFHSKGLVMEQSRDCSISFTPSLISKTNQNGNLSENSTRIQEVETDSYSAYRGRSYHYCQEYQGKRCFQDITLPRESQEDRVYLFAQNERPCLSN